MGSEPFEIISPIDSGDEAMGDEPPRVDNPRDIGYHRNDAKGGLEETGEQ